MNPGACILDAFGQKTRPAAGLDIACKWKRNYQGSAVNEAWFILTALGLLPAATAAYKQRMGIEQMFPGVADLRYEKLFA